MANYFIINQLSLNCSYPFLLAFVDITHTARHSFATSITLSNGVPIESVSKMLGHTNIRTTQIYAKITDRKISKDMDALAQKYSRRKQG